jgi:hypothetical protein
MSAAANIFAVRGELDVGAVDAGPAQQHGGVGQRQQVVDLEAEVVGDLGQAVLAAAGGGDPAGDVGGEDRREDERPPAQPAAHAQAGHRLAQVGRDR